MSFRSTNPVETFAEAVYSALSNKEYLPDIAYERQTPEQRKNNEQGNTYFRRPYTSDISVYHFPQTWGSTALGFGGIGGQAFTTAYTTVVIGVDDVAAVFFDGKHAYTIQGFNEEFDKDISNHRMKSISEKFSYTKN